MDKLILVKSPSKVMLAFVQQWRFDLDGKEECDGLMGKALQLLQLSASSDEVELARSWMAIDWMAREFAPAFLELNPNLLSHAKALRSINPITDSYSAKCAQDKLDAARDAAGDAAWAAARDAAGDAARDAARDAAGDAARDAAWAAWSSAGAAAWDAARDAAGDAARDAAGDAAWAAWSSAGAAAWDAARDALNLARLNLQISAIDLLERMANNGGKITQQDEVFMNCSHDDSGGITDDEKLAFIEHCQLSTITPQAMDGLQTTTKRRL